MKSSEGLFRISGPAEKVAQLRDDVRVIGQIILIIRTKLKLILLFFRFSQENMKTL